VQEITGWRVWCGYNNSSATVWPASIADDDWWAPGRSEIWMFGILLAFLLVTVASGAFELIVSWQEGYSDCKKPRCCYLQWLFFLNRGRTWMKIRPLNRISVCVSVCAISSFWMFLEHITCTQCIKCGLLIQMMHVAWSVCLSVCLWAGHVDVPCKNALDGVEIAPREGAS